MSIDYAHPGNVIDATRAAYLLSPGVPSPMGADVSSFGEQSAAGVVQKEKGGDVMNWASVQQHLRERAHS